MSLPVWLFAEKVCQAPVQAAIHVDYRGDTPHPAALRSPLRSLSHHVSQLTPLGLSLPGNTTG